MRLVGLFSFQATVLLLFALALRWHGLRVAIIAVVQGLGTKLTSTFESVSTALK
jgi:hypothetical protein